MRSTRGSFLPSVPLPIPSNPLFAGVNFYCQYLAIDVDGHFAMSPGMRFRLGNFLSRLAAQIPPPRFHMLSYYGVPAPAAGKRHRIVPGYEDGEDDERREHSCARKPLESATPNRPRRRARLYYPWAELLRRTFLVDVLACPCGAKRRVLSLGRQAEAPARAPPRAVQGVMRF